MASLGLCTRTLCALWLAAVVSLPSHAAENLQLVEQQIKAGLLYNFLKYTQWPSVGVQTSATIRVCLFGGDPFAGHLQPMAGRTVNQQAIDVRTVRTVAEFDDCSLLFVHVDQKANWDAIQRALAGKAVLTVSDYEGFAAAGGMIEFTRAANRIGVIINRDAITIANLEVEDRLLRLASARRTTPPGR